MNKTECKLCRHEKVCKYIDEFSMTIDKARELESEDHESLFKIYASCNFYSHDGFASKRQAGESND